MEIDESASPKPQELLFAKYLSTDSKKMAISINGTNDVPEMT